MIDLRVTMSRLGKLVACGQQPECTTACVCQLLYCARKHSGTQCERLRQCAAPRLLGTHARKNIGCRRRVVSGSFRGYWRACGGRQKEKTPPFIDKVAPERPGQKPTPNPTGLFFYIFCFKTLRSYTNTMLAPI